MSKKYDKWLRNREWLEEKYLEERLRLREIAEIVGCDKVTVWYALKHLNISIPEEEKREFTFRGKHHTEEAKKKISEGNTGKNNHEGNKNSMYGKHHSEETKHKLREAAKGNKKWLGKHHTEEAKNKICESRKHRKFPKQHTKPERIWQEIAIEMHLLPFKYVGDSSFWIGGKPAINPDFIHLTKKIVVEIFSYWHDPLKRHCKVPYHQTYEGRKKILKKRGWKMIVFWQEDLEREDAEKHILRVLKKEKVI